MEESSAQKLSNDFETAFFSLLQGLEQFGLILHSLSVSLFSFEDVSELESAFAALSFTSKAVLVEGVAAHEVDRGEGETVLAVGAVI